MQNLFICCASARGFTMIIIGASIHESCMLVSTRFHGFNGVGTRMIAAINVCSWVLIFQYDFIYDVLSKVFKILKFSKDVL